MSSSASNTNTKRVDYSKVTKEVDVHGYPYGHSFSRHSRKLASYFIDMGYRVTNRIGQDLTHGENADGSRFVKIGEDVLGSYYDKERKKTEARAAKPGQTHGRPNSVGERVLTDYEAARAHDIENCEQPNCDNPAHFPADLLYQEEDTKAEGDDAEKKGDKDGEGDAGGAAAPVST